MYCFDAEDDEGSDVGADEIAPEVRTVMTFIHLQLVMEGTLL